MSRSSLHKIKTLAVMLNSYAVQHDITQKNYASFIKLPKWVKSEKEAFTDVEIKKLFDSVGSEKWADTILIMIHTGMRINELLSLTKFQIDLTNNVIKTGSKTDAGNRVIPIHAKIKPLIVTRYEEAEDYLFSNQRKRIDPNNYRRHLYYPTLERLGIRRLTPHSCRHTFASLLARAKVQTVNIQKLLGHTDYSLTANVYTHPDVLELQTAINQI
jgi:integrase